MAVAIRLKRMGRIRKPFYRVIVIDSRSPRQGMVVDDLGFYNPMQNPAQIDINSEKALSWLNEGAVPSNTVKSLLSKIGVWRVYRGHGQLEVEETEIQEEEKQEEIQEEAQEVEQSDSEPDSE